MGYNDPKPEFKNLLRTSLLACDQIKLWDEIENGKSMFVATSSLLVCTDQGIVL